jgi:hypothetical protein
MKKRRILKISVVTAILALWGISMLWLLREEGILRYISKDGEIITAKHKKKLISLQDSWMGIYQNKEKIGYSHTTISPIIKDEVERYLISQNIVLF